MTPEQAIALIDKHLADLPTNRATHVMLQQAVVVVQEALKPQNVADDEEESEA